jgi:hypothetical protein
MLKSLSAVGAVVTMTALAGGSMAPAIGQSTAGRHDDDDHDRVVRVLSTTTEEANIDAGEHDFSLGDSFVFTSTLTKSGRRVGHTGVVCTITSTKREESQCVGTAVLPGGQISVQGLDVGERPRFELPITGGTGDFEDAGGTLVVREVSDTQELLAFHLDD